MKTITRINKIPKYWMIPLYGVIGKRGHTKKFSIYCGSTNFIKTTLLRNMFKIIKKEGGTVIWRLYKTWTSINIFYKRGECPFWKGKYEIPNYENISSFSI